jgi:hypothetical protein
MPHTSVTITVIPSIEYLNMVKGFLKPYLLNFFLILPPILLVRSCAIPSGQRKEQYVRPVINVSKRIPIKPQVAMVLRSKNFMHEGMN